jgi:tetratricopeptide (TPR) repeat protein
MNTKNQSNKKQSAQQTQKKAIQNSDNKNKWIWYTLGFVALVTFVIYSKATKFDFIYNWDDRGYVSENNDINGLQWSNIKLFFTQFYVGNYQPVTMLLYAIEHKFSAGKASIFHFGNILLHIVNTYLVFLFIRKISPQNKVVALITAAFFAVHPMHVESVAWVAETKDVMYSFFFLLSLIKYTDYLNSDKLKFLIYSGVFFILSCMSKPAAVILPPVMLLLDYYLQRKFSWKMLIEKIPFFSISLVFGLVAIHSQVDAIQVMAAKLSFLEHIAIVSHSFLSYLYRAIIPINLSAVYPYPLELGKTLPLMYYGSIVLVGALLFFVWYSRKWGREVIFGFLFFVITIILVLQFVQVGAATMADRYTYIPYVGIFFIIGKLYERITSELNLIKYKNVFVGALIVGFISFSVITHNRVKVWENDVTLFSDVIEKYPDTSIPYINRALYYMKFYAENPTFDPSQRQSYMQQSVADFDTALKKPLNAADSAKVYYSRGTIRYYLGDLQGAVGDYDKTILVDPKYSSAYNNRAAANFTLKNYEAAMHDFDKMIELNPGDVSAISNRAKAKQELKDFDGAMRDLNNALQIDNKYANAYFYKASIEVELKDYPAAIKDLDNLIILEPSNSSAYSIRGFSKHMSGNFKGALDDYNSALSINPKDSDALKNKALLGAY